MVERNEEANAVTSTLEAFPKLTVEEKCSVTCQCRSLRVWNAPAVWWWQRSGLWDCRLLMASVTRPKMFSFHWLPRISWFPLIQKKVFNGYPCYQTFGLPWLGRKSTRSFRLAAYWLERYFLCCSRSCLMQYRNLTEIIQKGSMQLFVILRTTSDWRVCQCRVWTVKSEKVDITGMLRTLYCTMQTWVMKSTVKLSTAGTGCTAIVMAWKVTAIGYWSGAFSFQ